MNHLTRIYTNWRTRRVMRRAWRLRHPDEDMRWRAFMATTPTRRWRATDIETRIKIRDEQPDAYYMACRLGVYGAGMVVYCARYEFRDWHPDKQESHRALVAKGPRKNVTFGEMAEHRLHDYEHAAKMRACYLHTGTEPKK